MFGMTISGKGRNFEDIAEVQSSTIGGAFVLDENVWKDGKASVRSWLVWVRKSQVQYAKRKVGAGQYKVVVIADDFVPSVNFAGEVRLLDIQEL
jgi:hypothetical protein